MSASLTVNDHDFAEVDADGSIRVGDTAVIRNDRLDVVGKVVAMTCRSCVLMVMPDGRRMGLRERGASFGQEVLASWEDVFIPVEVPSETYSEIAIRHRVKKSFKPTMAAPESISSEDGIEVFRGDDVVGQYIYFLCHCGVVVYVGQTGGLKKRVDQHTESYKTFDSVFYIPVPEGILPTEIESEFIKRLTPAYNKAGKPKS